MKKNILVIVTDQLAWRALPVYGDRYARTQAIDRICDNAAVFDACYTPYPLCQPARASFWTGVYPHETDVLSNGLNWPVKPVPDSFPAIGDVFKAAGFHTVHFGKKHDAGALRGFT
jgi:choline-sulfatase